MSLGIGYTPDPELEKLRLNSTTDPEYDFKQQIETWIEKTSNIPLQKAMGMHSCLSMCSILSKCINGTRLDAPGNWKDFAAYLGFDRLDIQRMENFTDIEGTATHILNSFAMKETGTVGTIIRVLSQLGRFDILNEIMDCVDELLKEKTANGNLSGAGATHAKPQQPVEETKLQRQGIPPPPKGNRLRRVFLTFAADGRDKALTVANIFKDKQINVVLLERNRDQLAEDPWLFVGRCFKMVDFVVPIITNGYASQIFFNNNDNCNSYPTLAEPDAFYLRLIFNLMCAEYLQNLCKNYRVRALVDDDVRDEVSGKLVLLYPMFFGCHRLSETNKLAELIKNAKLKKPGH